ncbi:MAG TPA: protein kinase, partial [Myxococcota bacterium]|nr:protein kinase [Myxococcota bacterium]
MDELGVGGSARVVHAHDLLLDRPVAIKQLTFHAPHDLPRIHREIVAMRLARLPGIVQLHDAFVAPWPDERPREEPLQPTLDTLDLDGAAPVRRDPLAMCLVMDLVPGRPFGADRPAPWGSLRDTTCKLLVTLTHLHFAGLVHHDLKPGNVLVHRGVPIILDLGVSTGSRLRQAPAGDLGLTVRYAAPESRRRRSPCSASDLYSVGAMLFEALTGELHLAGHDAYALLDRSGEDPPLPEMSPSIHEEARTLLLRLLEPDPARRLSALEAVRLLGAAPPIVPPSRVARARGDLRELFAGPEVFLHLPSDASRALRARAGDDLDLQTDEVNSWIRAGYATFHDDQVHITSARLHELEQGEPLDAAPVPPTPDRPLLYAVRALYPHADPTSTSRVLGVERDVVEATASRLIEQGLLRRLGDGSLATRPGVGDDDERRFRSEHLDTILAALPADSERRLRLRALVRPDDPSLLADLCDAVERSVDAGEHEQIAGMGELALSLARAHGDRQAERRVLACVVEEAIARPSTASLDRAARHLAEA